MTINKKAEITSEEIVHWIIFAICVLILLYFISRMDFTRTFDQQLCSLSVKAQEIAPDSIKSKIPMMCNTQKLCISRDGTCESFKDRKIHKVKSVAEIYDFLGEQMADCWWMFGEGKVNYIQKDVSGVNLYCGLCSEVVFDNSVYALTGNVQEPTIGKIELYQYLENKKYSEKQSYSQYMSLQTSKYMQSLLKTNIELSSNDVGVTTKLEIPQNELNNLKEGITNTIIINSVEIPKIDLTKRYYVLTGVFNKIDVVGSSAIASGKGTFIGLGVAFAVITLATGGLGATVAYPTLLYLGAGAIGAGVSVGLNSIMISNTMQGTGGNTFMVPTIIEADSDKMSALKCSRITTTS